MRRRGQRPRAGAAGLVLAVASAALWLAVGCGGGGGSPSQPPTPPPPTPGLRFTPAGAAGANSISLVAGAGGTATVLFLEVRANQLDDAYGVAFDLAYPTAVIDFVTATEGTFLAADGSDVSLQVVESPAGNLVVGITRLGAVGGTSGSGLLLTLQFAAAGAGSGSLTFSENRVFRPNGDAQAGVGWLAGSVEVVR